MNDTLDISTAPPPVTGQANDGEKPACIYVQVKIERHPASLSNHFSPPDNFIGGLILEHAIQSTLVTAGFKPEWLVGAGPVNSFCALISVPRSQVVPAMAPLLGLLEKVTLDRFSMMQWQPEGETLFRIYHHGDVLGEPKQITQD